MYSDGIIDMIQQKALKSLFREAKKMILQISLLSITLSVLAGCSSLSIPFIADSKTRAIEFSMLSEAQQKHYELSLHYIESGHYDVAQGKLLALIEEYPNYPDAHNALGVIYERRGRVTIASESFLEAIKLKPEYDVAVLNYGRLMCYMDNSAGIIAASEAMNDKRVKSRLYTANARCYISNNDYKNAQIDILKAIGFDDQYAAAYLILAEIYQHNSAFSLASGALNQFNDLNGYTKESARLGVEINQKLGNTVEVAKYQNVLTTQFSNRTIK